LGESAAESTVDASADSPARDRILACVERIPRGRVMTYGDVAEYAGVSSARIVGRVLSRDGGSVPWHRVLRADGSCAEPVRSRQMTLLRNEKVPMRGERVDLRLARWDGR